MALRDLGLTELQERLYRLLLDEPKLTVVELAASLHSIDEDVHAALDELVEFGLVNVNSEQPSGLVVPNPLVALGELIEAVEDDLLSRTRRVSDTRAELPQLSARHGRGPAVDLEAGVERISDVDAVRARIEELAFFARTSVYAIQPGHALSPEALRAGVPLDERALRRRTDLRVIHDPSVLENEQTRQHVERIVARGGQARVSPVALSRLIVFDQQVAVVPIDPANSRAGAFVVREPGLVVGLVQMFLSAWDDAEPPPSGEIEEPDPAKLITDEDRALLRLLGTGCTDDAAARQIGLSVRHLRRQVARLMEELDASSRFEAGVEAARRGWI